LNELKVIVNLGHWLWAKHILGKRILVKRVQGNLMYLDLCSPGISKALAIFGIREREHTELMKRTLRKGMTVVDIGANIGYYALLEASLVSPGGKVYAFEPFPDTFELMRRSVRANHYESVVETYNMAMSNTTGKAKLYLAAASNQHIMLDPGKYSEAAEKAHRKHGEWEYIEVETTTLDDFLRDKGPVDLVRMDVEGFEWQIIDGAMETLTKAEEGFKLFIEIHPPYEHNNQFAPRWEKMRALGFEPMAVISARVRPHRIFADLGYEPQEVIFSDGFYRGVYYNISAEDLPILVSHHPPKVVRYIILEKRRRPPG